MHMYKEDGDPRTYAGSRPKAGQSERPQNHPGRKEKSKRKKMAATPQRVTLARDAKRHDLQLEQVTAENLRRIFQVINFKYACYNICACACLY